MVCRDQLTRISIHLIPNQGPSPAYHLIPPLFSLPYPDVNVSPTRVSGSCVIKRFLLTIISAATLVLDMEALLLHLATLVHVKANEHPTSVIAAIKHDYIAAVLSIILTFGTNEQIDRVCLDSLGITPSNGATGLAR